MPLPTATSDFIPELLAPAGNWDCAMAAISNGANAIYFGLPRFNARLRADNFTEQDLPDLMYFLHSHNARGFVTMNTLVFSSEMEEAIEYLRILEASQVDGVIVQDIGLASLVKQVAPGLELHASTQMTISSREGLDFLRGFLPLDRAVLAREMSLREIEKIHPEEFPIEVFVHGALCVAYSGQCLTSESLGQRSANRGECAQACRMPYELICDGKKVPLGERRYLLSPQDLAAIDCIPDMVKMGILSYKIEGRLKSPEYVAAVTAAYRKALDAACNNIPVNRAITSRDRYNLQMVFSRGFSTGWLKGANHPLLTHGRHGKKRGAYAGIISSVGKGWVDVEFESRLPLAPGDGFVFDDGDDRNKEQGGRIWKVEGNRLFFHGKTGSIHWPSIRPGMKIWKTDDPALNALLRKTWTKERPERKYPLHLRISGKEGAPLTLRATEFNTEIQSDLMLTLAEKHPLDEAKLRAQLGRLGDTPFTLGELDLDLAPNLHLPVSALNSLRRDLVSLLPVPQSNPTASTHTTPVSFPKPEANPEPLPAPSLSVLCRQPGQLKALLEAGASFLYLDFEDIRFYKESVELVRQYPGTTVFLATPRIQKPGETGFFKVIENASPDGVLIRNLGGLEYFREKSIRKIGDFSLNTANFLTAHLLLKEAGLERVTLSYDLNINQILDLLEKSDPATVELVLHQHMPMFHMEHCVFCTFLSTGKNHLDCGRPCEKHEVYLRDRVGQQHRLMADAGCRNTVYNGKAQTGLAFLPDLLKAGLRHYRLDVLDESPDNAVSLWKGYSDILSGKAEASHWLRSLDVIERIGVTEGTLKNK